MTKLSISISAVLAIAAVYGDAAKATTTPWSHEQDSDLGFRFHILVPCLPRSREMENQPSIISCPRTPMPN